ncbi:hypothetical protein CPB86DRAFT_810009 [Serendipita vermifera]|nr:hypothetical protein CPB86DRAFT_810009 [Serendipita vermifera]
MATTDSQSIIERDNDEESLQEHRIKLLTSICQWYETGEVDFEAVCAEKAQYNRVIDSINTLQAKHRLDPIDKLPPELFAEIIHEAVFSEISLDPLLEWKVTKANDDILSLTLVSRRWMQFIINTPIYWTHIVLDEDKGDCFSTASTFLQLSGDLSITVSIRNSLALEQSTTWLELLKHRNRIVLVAYGTANFYMEDNTLLSNFQKVMEMLSPLPRLNTLQCCYIEDMGDSVLQYILDIYPSLSEIYGIEISERSLRRLMSRNCKSIILTQDPVPLIEVLEGNPSLRKVVIDFNSTLSTTELPSFNRGSVLNWSTLNIYEGLSLSFSHIITNRMIHLTYLSVDGHLESLVQLATSIHRFPRLQALSLGLWFSRLARFEGILPASFPSNVHIRSFSFFVDLRSNSTLLLVEQTEMQKNFTRLVLQSLPAIGDLSLSFEEPSMLLQFSKVFDPSAMNHLPVLQSFHLTTNLAIDYDELPPCEELTIICLHSENILRLSNRETRKLHLMVRDSSQINYGLSDQSWPCIERVSLPVYIISKSYTGFPHLREISLETWTLPDSLTKFCLNLALYPDFCPTLEELSMKRCPEWDIFFIMLERRLRWSINGSRALKAVALPSYTPRSLLRFISEIVQGKLPDRPSNFELSLFGKVELLLDREMYVYTWTRKSRLTFI